MDCTSLHILLREADELEKRKTIYCCVIKPLLGRFFAFTIILFFFWLYLLIAIAIFIDDPGPVIFRQKRIGKDGKVFELLKFRSMYMNSEYTGTGVYSYKNDPRITRVGRLLRATSLDELPQAINILKGEMALIGPRPPLTYHPWPFEDYSPEQRRMFQVLPGITGWAQIHGRKTVEWNKRIRLNVWYVDHVSFRLDLYIFLRTILKVMANDDNTNRGKTI